MRLYICTCTIVYGAYALISRYGHGFSVTTSCVTDARLLSVLWVRTARGVDPIFMCTCTIVYDAYVRTGFTRGSSGTSG